MTRCPYCREQIADEAVKCRHCHSMLLPGLQAGNANAEAADQDRVVLVLDRGLIYFGKFALAIIGLFAIIAAVAFGIDLKSARDDLLAAREATDNANRLNAQATTTINKAREAIAQVEEKAGAATAQLDELATTTARITAENDEISRQARQTQQRIEESASRLDRAIALSEESANEIVGDVHTVTSVLLALMREDGAAHGDHIDRLEELDRRLAGFDQRLQEQSALVALEQTAVQMIGPTSSSPPPQARLPVPSSPERDAGEAPAAAGQPLTDLQKKAVQAIVNIFETGKVAFDYAQVTPSGGYGRLTYGKPAASIETGTLFQLVEAYTDQPSARFAEAFRPYLGRLEAKDASLEQDEAFIDLLGRAAADPVMQEVQEGLFDRLYWEPAVRAAEGLGVNTALGIAICYDSLVHGSWARMRDRTSATAGPPEKIGEKAWIAAYVATRREWFAGNSVALLRRSGVYRMDAFQRLIDAGNWDLELPFTVAGVEVTRTALEGDAGPPAARTLRLTAPLMTGPDVESVQRALQQRGHDVVTDGVYGLSTEVAVKQFQERTGLAPDGVVDARTREALGLI